ncbi:DUF3147 family protein [Massilia niabensis]|uniref:DUF3147 family protein n=1 Tax=Massilia niabensis TaxID=544910 RepID=A0ABW0L5B9_9BURK
MKWLITKDLITAAVVVRVSEVAKRSDRFGSFVAALPMITLLTLVWLHIEKQPEARLANHAWYTFWYVVPTPPMLLAFPWLLQRVGFWWTLGSCALITAVSVGAFAMFVKRFGIELL